MSQQPSVKGDVHQALAHDSALRHVTGEAKYIDDMAEPAGCLHAAIGMAEVARAQLQKLDLKAVVDTPGVELVLSAEDFGEHNDISPTGRNDEPVFAHKEIEFYGQPLFAVIAQTREIARRAAKKAIVTYSESATPVIDVDQALGQANRDLVTEPLTLKKGNADLVLANAGNRLAGCLHVGGQDHFYLEGHIALAVPGEGNEMLVWSSTQHPSEVQHMVAHTLGIASHAVTVKVRRMGGGFGGKETQSNLFAVVASLAARKTARAVKLRPDRDDDMIMTGKRHDFRIDYDVGFDDEGAILALKGQFAARCGYSADLSGPVTDRALFHADNAYYLPAAELRSVPLKTNTVSNTAFRGFGGPQGLLSAERVIEEIAYHLGKDPLDVRLQNLYGIDERNITPYHQTITDNILHRLITTLETDANYRKRRQDIIAFNKDSRCIRKGIALTPVKFGISFTATWMNQAGALLQVYRDGSILLNHGGTEMGQGLFIKVAQVIANELQVDIDRIQVTATATDKVPNTSATAASSGSDLNAMAALDAAQKIKSRLITFAAGHYNTSTESIRFINNHVYAGSQRIKFDDLIEAAYMGRTSLSATGFYRTPDIHWDRDTGTGRPFFYYAYGASVSEVSIDLLTGEYQVDRTDILHDVGNSLNPAIDRGQIEGGFVQGMGWLTTEELWWDDKGRLRTHAPSTYKIPLASDRPKVFNVKLAEWSKNPERTIRRSKAVGEPPLMLAVSVLEALSMAVASVADYAICPRLNTPATPEVILSAVEKLKAEI